MNRREGILRLVRMRIERLEEIDNKFVKANAHRCLDAIRLLEDNERDSSPPPVNVWLALKRIVRTGEAMVSAFDNDNDVPSRFVEHMRENLKDLVDCEIKKVV